MSLRDDEDDKADSAMIMGDSYTAAATLYYSGGNIIGDDNDTYDKDSYETLRLNLIKTMEKAVMKEWCTKEDGSSNDDKQKRKKEKYTSARNDDNIYRS